MGLLNTVLCVEFYTTRINRPQPHVPREHSQHKLSLVLYNYMIHWPPTILTPRVVMYILLGPDSPQITHISALYQRVQTNLTD